MARLESGLVALALVVACGGGESGGNKGLSAGSAGSGGQGGGGMPNIIVGTAGGGASGSSGGGTTDGGSGGEIQLHECPAMPEPECPAKVIDSYESDSLVASDLQGVTEVTGDITLRLPEELMALDCLRTVGGNLEIDFFLADFSGPVSLWPLRNLRSTGGSVDIYADSVETWIDCGLQHLESVGEAYLTGGAVDIDGEARGVLDLSALQTVTHIRIESSGLTQVALPSNVPLTMGQLWFDNNGALSAVLGFENVTLMPSSIQVSGAQSLRIVNNPNLSTCRANELKTLFVNAGFSESTMEISGNLADCP